MGTVTDSPWPQQTTEDAEAMQIATAYHDLGAGETERRQALMSAEALVQDNPEAVALLQSLVPSLAPFDPKTMAPLRFDLSQLTGSGRTLVAQVLGEGEVSMIATKPEGGDLKIQEAVMPGLWRVLDHTASGACIGDWIEIADVPAVIRSLAQETTDLSGEIAKAPESAMNVMPVLAEVRDRMRIWAQNQDKDHELPENHVINLTLLPMNEADMAFLGQTLGAGALKILSRGYGLCKITATRWRSVWTVRFVNAMDNTVLETLEIGDVPIAARAHVEDFKDAAARLQAVLEAYLS